MHTYFIQIYLIYNNYQLIANVVSLVYINTTDTEILRALCTCLWLNSRNIIIGRFFMTNETDYYFFTIYFYYYLHHYFSILFGFLNLLYIFNDVSIFKNI